MFSLEKVKQQKLHERHTIAQKLNVFNERKRPVFSFVCDSSVNIIAEIKKASPSSGIIKDVDAGMQAMLYSNAGAKAISVLTDTMYFGGSFDDLHQAASATTLPVLCKEFVCFKEQIDVAYNAGADIILLITAMLSSNELQYLYEYTCSKGLLPLVEVHTTSELECVLPLNPQYVMVNVRNLATLSLEYDTAIETLRNIPIGINKICASGINTPNMLQHINKLTGTRIFLVGTSLMKSENPMKMLEELRNVC
ncbi:MAG: indole-3-glycerol-phosphate synthase [Spirochaetes bacterium]|nr:indole-3-glycerol-phosphate synthase [Spirochaetota bacterium]